MNPIEPLGYEPQCYLTPQVRSITFHPRYNVHDAIWAIKIRMNGSLAGELMYRDYSRVTCRDKFHACKIIKEITQGSSYRLTYLLS